MQRGVGQWQRPERYRDLPGHATGQRFSQRVLIGLIRPIILLHNRVATLHKVRGSLPVPRQAPSREIHRVADYIRTIADAGQLVQDGVDWPSSLHGSRTRMRPTRTVCLRSKTGTSSYVCADEYPTTIPGALAVIVHGLPFGIWGMSSALASAISTFERPVSDG